MRTLRLYGHLAERFGEEFRIHAKDIGAAIRLMEANFPVEFSKALRIGSYRVLRGPTFQLSRAVPEDLLGLSLGGDNLFIVPVVDGSGGGGNGKGIMTAVIGVVLVAAAFVTAGASLAAGASYFGSTGALATTTMFGGLTTASSVALFGGALALSGVSSLLAPTPNVGVDNYTGRNNVDGRQSFMFDGAVNSTEQGGARQLVYGEVICGSTVISGGISSEQF